MAVRRGVPGARPGRGRRPRGLQVLLPPPLPARHRRVGPAEPPLAAPRQAPGSRGGVRRQERLGARGPPRPGEALAALGSRPARVRLGAAAVVQERGRGARRDPRSRRPDRHDLVRQDRCPGPRRSAPARTRRLQPDRPRSGKRHLHAVPERRRRDRRRRDRDAARRGPVPRRDRRGRRRLGPRLAAGERRPRGRPGRAARREHRPGGHRDVGPGGPRGAPGRNRGRRLGRGVPVSHGVRSEAWPEPT